MSVESLLDIKRRPVEDVVKGLKSKSHTESVDAGRHLVAEANRYGVDIRDYLNLAVSSNDTDLSGYEATLAYLNLPVRADIKNGIVLQAASETFQTHAGTRALFPEVVDDMIRWEDRMAIFESVTPLVANTRTMSGTELITTVVDDDSDERDTYTVPELARIPVRSIRTSEYSVKFFKHGSAIRTSYEFNRRASLDLLTPYVNRIARELEKSKLRAALYVVINGDGVHSAAPTTLQGDLDSDTGVTSTDNKICWENFLYWLMLRAKAGTPVDTVIGNWDSAYMWARLWEVNGSNTVADMDNFQRVAPMVGYGGLSVTLPRFVVASDAPAQKLIGITKGETLEELKEANSNISESERNILNQSINYVKTENTGYRLVWGDTRAVYNYAAA